MTLSLTVHLALQGVEALAGSEMEGTWGDHTGRPSPCCLLVAYCSSDLSVFCNILYLSLDGRRQYMIPQIIALFSYLNGCSSSPLPRHCSSDVTISIKTQSPPCPCQIISILSSNASFP